MKKILMLSTFCGLIGSASADEGSGHFKSGVTIGANVGVTSNANKFHDRLQVFGGGASDGTLKSSKRKTSALGELSLGGRLVKSKWLFGFDVSVNLDGHRVNKNFNFTDAGAEQKFRLKKSIGIIPAIQVGRVFRENDLAFVKLGTSINRYRIHFVNPAVPSAIDAQNKTRVGFAGQIGWEHSFSHHISSVFAVGGEWNGSVKGKFTDPIPAQGGFAATPSLNTVKVKTNALQARVGILFKL